MENELIKKLISGIDKTLNKSNLDTFSKELMQLFLEAGSKTSDNLICNEYVEYGIVLDRQYGPKNIQGLKVKGKDMLLADVMNVLEDAPLPSEVKQGLPNLTDNEWKAALRMTTMILLSLEKPNISPDESQ